MNTQAALSPAVAEVFITEQLAHRTATDPDYLREKLAIQDLAQAMSDHPSEVLPRLVTLAMENCSASSAGISVLEPEAQLFRWTALTGVLSTFEGATTPRHFSPCGICLDQLAPILMAYPERVYDWIREANITVPEVLLVPLAVKGDEPLGTLWIVADEGHHFNAGHARVMTELASFAGLALKMIQTESRMKTALQQQELLTSEMSHRVKNLFALVNGMVRMTARTAENPKAMAEALSGRLDALATAHGLIRKSFVENAKKTTDLQELAETILQPHNGMHLVDGPVISLGNHAANDLALVLHELATNASKYGSLRETGSVTIDWSITGDMLQIDWVEHGGSAVTSPTRKGFGTSLTEKTLSGRLGGSIAYHWEPEGLVVAMIIPTDCLRY